MHWLSLANSSSYCKKKFRTLTFALLAMSSPLTTTTSVSSDNKKSPAPHKDYAAAFGNLQSSYGANGHAPVQPHHTASTIVSDEADRQRPRRETLFDAGRTENEATKGGPQSSSSHKKKSFKGAFTIFGISCCFGGSSTNTSH